MADAFDVAVAHEGGLVTVRPRGSLEGAATAVLGEILDDLAHQGSSAVLDLSGLTGIDRDGVRLVLSAHATSRRDGLGLTMLPGPPVVMRMFELAGVLPELPFEPDAGRSV